MRPSDIDTVAQQVESLGFATVESILSETVVNSLRASLASLPDRDEVRRKENVYGVRNLLRLCPAVQELAASDAIRPWVSSILGPNAFAVRATLFDKVPDANWNLRYHQDSVISVKEPLEVAGFTAWSEKNGVWQVRPPIDVLREMLAIRIHLDDCPAENGALRILAGSHLQRWARSDIPGCRHAFQEHVAAVGCGGVLAMRPLVLHASSASTLPSHRRVIHIEYAADPLPGGLQWYQQIPIQQEP